MGMWPFREIKELERKCFELEMKNAGIERQNNDLKTQNDELKSLRISVTDKKELDFLRAAIKDYVVYSMDNQCGYGWVPNYQYFAKRTLKDTESDLTKAKFYISVLEAQMTEDQKEAAKNVCERLKELCTMKAKELE